MQHYDSKHQPTDEVKTVHPLNKITEASLPTGRKAYKDAILLFIKMLVTIFLCEAAVMALLHILPPQRGWEIITNPLLLTILGTPILYWLVVRPIWLALEQRNHAVGRLRESEEKHRTFFETMSQGVIYQDACGQIISANPAAERILGLRLDQMKGFTSADPLWRSIHEDGSDFPGEKHPSIISLKTGNPEKDVRMGIFNPNAEQYYWININSVPLFRKGENKPYKVYTTFEDITERKEAEESLRESENRYRAVVENAAEGIVVVQDRVLKFINPKVTSIMGCTEEELMSRPFIEFVHPEDRELVMGIHLKRIKRDEVPKVYEFRILDKQDNTIWLESNGILIDWSGGPATLNFLRDITERKKAEDELKENEERFRSLSNAAFEGIVITKEGKLVDANAAFTDLFGYKPDEITGMEVMMLVAPEDRQMVIENIQSGYDKPYEHKALRKDGSILDVEVCGKIVLIKGQECRITAVRDISDRKKAEEKLLDYQAKLKSLASKLSLTEESERRRIATELHDQIGQSLVFSKIKLDELHKTVTSSELTKALDEICSNIDQVIQDTRTLTFDLSSPILNELGFEAAISEWLDVQVREKHGIETEFVDDGQQKPLDDDIRALLFRNVRELLVNVIKHADANKVKVSVSRVNEHIHIDVEDDGKGFDSAKAISTGIEDTKFGLFSIRQRLEQLGGHFEIESEDGSGSKIMMTAPLKLTISTK